MLRITGSIARVTTLFATKDEDKLFMMPEEEDIYVLNQLSQALAK